ncbi:FG-GAP repeat domain-containing protein [Kitasatospora cheerisanensis]|uniref:Uncharacterized protein n=1 Tax=Kitasatospora cheerisanensis KCTC 2395 TaxID=1348663 RepID=A0A066ZDK4_9ACTN|nr:VCBS repeat-containing protein [Kitasatospora cheerisanensis]KDN88180.1 hypothetical protein KCH_00300 [Kitasatospora cheerisanensis KCTC 2395]
MTVASHRRRATTALAALGVVLAATGALAPAAGAAQRPAPLTGLRTVPGTDCAGGTLLGLGDVALSADATTSAVEFQLLRAGTYVPVADATVAATPGTASVYGVARETLAAAAGGAITDFDWKARAKGGPTPGSWSTTCHFRYDPTVPAAAPQLTVPAGLKVGTPAQITVASTGGQPPAAYEYRLGAGAPHTAAADAAGGAVLTVTPESAVAVLTVTPLSPGGNRGPAATATLYAQVPAPVTGDYDGDGRADLLLAGGRFGLGEGLWMAKGQPGGGLAPAVQVGAGGTGRNAPGSAADWNGTQVVGGRYANRNGVLAYVPSAGVATALPYAAGSFDPNRAVNISSRTFVNSTTGAHVEQLADGGELYRAGVGIPTGDASADDLLALADGKLYLLAAAGVPGAYSTLDGAVELSATNPAGTGDWHGWTIASAVVGPDRQPGLFARDDAGGALYYYEASALTGPLATGDPIGAPVLVAASGWDAAADPLLQGADLNGDSTADLWSVDAQGNATAHLFNGTTMTPLATSAIHPVS